MPHDLCPALVQPLHEDAARLGDRPGCRRGHPHAIAAAQAPAPAVRPADDPVRARCPDRLRVRRTVVVAGHGAERVTKKLQDQSPDALNVDFVEQHVQRGTGDAVSVGLTAFTDDDVDDTSTCSCSPATPAAAPPDHHRAGPRARGQRQRRHHPLGPGRRPHRLRPGHPGQGRHRQPHRRAPRRRRRRARHRRDQHQRLLLPAQPARTGAASPRARQRAGRVLPHRRRRGAHDGRLLGRGEPDARPGRGPGRQRPRPAGVRRGRAAAPHQPALAAGRRHHGRPRPHLHRRHRRPGARRHALPRHHAAGPHGRGGGERDRPRHPPRRLRGRPRRRRGAHRRPRRRDRGGRPGGTVRRAAAGVARPRVDGDRALLHWTRR